MSIGSLGLVGSLAATPMPQKAADIDKAAGDAADQAREAEATRQAEAAAGIGETEEDSQAADRDADGRRLWEAPREKRTDAAEATVTDQTPHLSKDPTGDAGGTLDLVG